MTCRAETAKEVNEAKNKRIIFFILGPMIYGLFCPGRVDFMISKRGLDLALGILMENRTDERLIRQAEFEGLGA